MEVLEIKNKLHEKIDKINNEELLLEALQLLELESNPEEILITDEVIIKMESARQEKLDGLTIEHSKANDQVLKWLREQ